jgi:hypothetical protein
VKNSSSVELLADESLDDRIIRFLRRNGVFVAAFREDCPGLPDQEVLERAHRVGAILLTEDSDFGTWVFAHRVVTTGVVFLRYRPGEHDLVAGMLQAFLVREGSALRGRSVTLTPKKTRFRVLESPRDAPT